MSQTNPLTMLPHNKVAFINSMLVIPWLVAAFLGIMFLLEHEDNVRLKADITVLQSDKQKLSENEADYKRMLGDLIKVTRPHREVPSWIPPLSPNTTGYLYTGPLEAQLEISNDINY